MGRISHNDTFGENSGFVPISKFQVSGVGGQVSGFREQKSDMVP